MAFLNLTIMAYQITKKEKQIMKMESVSFAIRAMVTLNLSFNTKEQNDQQLNAITKKIFNWIIERLTTSSASYSYGAGINRALMISENELYSFDTVDDMLEKAEKFASWFEQR